MEIHNHCWLSITWILKKSNSIQTPKTFQKRNYPPIPFCAKFTFDNSIFSCLEHLLFYPNNRLVSLRILRYQKLNLVAPISSLAMHKIIFFSFWLSKKWFQVWHQVTVKTFNTQNNQWGFCAVEKKAAIFLPQAILK